MTRNKPSAGAVAAVVSDDRTLHSTWTDWRGNPYTVGDTVLYPRLSGRSVHMCEGVVTDLFEVYQGADYKYVRLAPGETAPLHEIWTWQNPEDPAERSRYRRDGWEHVQVAVPRDTERRAKIKPTGRSSRFAAYWNKKWNPETHEFDETEQKPVTLTANVESITLPVP